MIELAFILAGVAVVAAVWIIMACPFPSCFQQWLYRRRIRREWKLAKGDYGQFLSSVGYRIARGHLSKEIIEKPRSVLDWNCGESFCSTEH